MTVAMKTRILALTLLAAFALGAGISAQAQSIDVESLENLSRDLRPEYFVRSVPNLIESQKIAHISEIQKRADVNFSGVERFISQNGELQRWLAVTVKQNQGWLHSRGAQALMKKFAAMDRGGLGALAGGAAPAPTTKRSVKAKATHTATLKPSSATAAKTGGAVHPSMNVTEATTMANAPGAQAQVQVQAAQSQAQAPITHPNATTAAPPNRVADHPANIPGRPECAKTSAEYRANERLKQAFGNTSDPFSKWSSGPDIQLMPSAGGQWSVTYMGFSVRTMPLSICVDPGTSQPYFLSGKDKFPIDMKDGQMNASLSGEGHTVNFVHASR